MQPSHAIISCIHLVQPIHATIACKSFPAPAQASSSAVPIGVQLCKMTPIRAGIVMYAVAVAAIFGRCLSMDVLHVYISVSPSSCYVLVTSYITLFNADPQWMHDLSVAQP